MLYHVSELTSYATVTLTSSRTKVCQILGVVGWCDGAGLGVLLNWILVGQGPTALAIGADWVVWTVPSLLYYVSLLSPFPLSQ